MGCCLKKQADGSGPAFTDLSEVDKKQKTEQDKAQKDRQQRHAASKGAFAAPDDKTEQKLKSYEKGSGGGGGGGGPAGDSVVAFEPAADPVDSGGGGGGFDHRQFLAMQAEEPVVKLKAPKSSIVEAVVSKPDRDPHLHNPPQPPEEGGLPPARREIAPPAFEQRGHPPKDEIAPSNGGGGGGPRSGLLSALDEEERQAQEQQRKLKEALRGEVQGPKSGFLGAGMVDALDEELINSGGGGNAHGAAEVVEVMGALDTSGGDTPVKENRPKRTAASVMEAEAAEARGGGAGAGGGGAIPSVPGVPDAIHDAWFEAKGFRKPGQVKWWQSKTDLGLTISVPAPKETQCSVRDGTVLLFQCKSASSDAVYGLEFELLKEVRKDVRVSESGACVDVTLTKARPQEDWPISQLLKGDKRRIAEAVGTWLDFDWSKSNLDDDDDEE